jgi:hypothetical protein
MDAILAIITDGGRAIILIYREAGRNKLISYSLYKFILNPSTAATANPLQRGSRGWGMFLHQSHATGGRNGSIMVEMFLCSCLASQNLSQRRFFIPARTDLGVKLLSCLTCNFFGKYTDAQLRFFFCILS